MSTTITPPSLPPAASVPPVTAPTPPRRQGPRTIAILTIAFGGLIIAGTVISAVLTTVGSAVARSETLSVDTSGITDLDIDVSGGELSVVFADIDEATLQVDGGWRATGWTLERNEEELVVRSPDGWFGWGWFGGVDRAVLTLPQPLQSERLDASLSLSAGSLDIDGTFGDLDLDLSAGEMVVAGTAQQLSVDVSAGGATLELEGVREAEVDVSAGGVRGSLSGAAPADLAITVSAGSVDLTLADEAYNVISDVSAGTLDNRLETSTSATRQVRVEISAGDVTLRPER